MNLSEVFILSKLAVRLAEIVIVNYFDEYVLKRGFYDIQN